PARATLSDETTRISVVKLCSRCGKKKPLDDFHRSSRYGVQAWCKPCGRVFPPSAMTWDHLPGSLKITEVSALVLQRHCSKRVVLAEIAKCELVCANCHAVRSEQRRGVAQPGQSAAFGTRRSPVRIRPPRLEPTD